MSQFEKIQKTIQQLKPALTTQKVELNVALNRVLQQDVLADLDMPPFHKSAMDGYACRQIDVGNEMEVLEVLHAGAVPEKKIGKNQCSKIMTGAAVPNGADCVFMVEHSREIIPGKVICTNPNTAENICYQGEDYKKGDVLIPKGSLIKEAHISVLAGAGCHEVIVATSPKIALVTTGSELVEPHEIPPKGKIRNSNASQVLAQLQKIGLNAQYLGLAKDNYEELKTLLTNTLKEFDILIFTGGASVGDFDFIPHILKDLHFSILWERTGIKPGNPMTVAHKDNKFCIGLSGNPVSSFVQFELIAKPLLYRLLGTRYSHVRIQAEMNTGYKRKKADRLAIVPVRLTRDGKVELIDFHGSAHINSLVFAHALMEVPVGTIEFKKGDKIHVRPL
jgi:molybdopterin molybdotransferase